MARTLLEAAVWNNAIWCDLICRTHGQPGEFYQHAWFTRGPAPRFYPNLITLTTAAGDQLEHIQSLLASDLPIPWAVKDSFSQLDLTPLGFRPLFAAHWLCRSPDQPKPRAALPAIRWAAIQDAQELAQWETAWGSEPGQPRLFRPELLADANIVFLAGWQGQALVAGAIANRSGDVVGLSNLFAPENQEADVWAGCLAALIERFPGLPVVDYEHGPDLVLALSLGFEIIGPLTIWEAR